MSFICRITASLDIMCSFFLSFSSVLLHRFTSFAPFSFCLIRNEFSSHCLSRCGFYVRRCYLTTWAVWSGTNLWMIYWRSSLSCACTITNWGRTGWLAVWVPSQRNSPIRLGSCSRRSKGKSPSVRFLYSLNLFHRSILFQRPPLCSTAYLGLIIKMRWKYLALRHQFLIDFFCFH